MGCCLSCRTSSSTLKNICVVHLNGYVEEFEHHITVRQVTGKPPKHFVYTQAQLLSGGLKPLKPDTQLEPGQVYFLLPHSTFRSDVSPVDLASIAKKLNTIAKTSHSKSKSKSEPARASFSSSPHRSSPMWSSPARSPSRFADRSIRVEPKSSVVAYGPLKSSKVRSWKPILDTIRERSFSRRSDLDLHEKHLETPKQHDCEVR